MSSTQRRGSSQAAGPSSSGAGPSPIERMAFLQAMMANGCMTETSAKALLHRMSGPCSDNQYLSVLAQANQDMAFAGFQLKILKNPVNDAKYVGLINKEADAASKMGTRLTVPQREYFKAVIERIARSDMTVNGVGMVGGMELLNLDVSVARPMPPETQATQAADDAGPSGTQAAAATQAPKPLNKKDRQTTLTELVSLGWLSGAPSHFNHYCLGVRTLMELDDFLSSLDGLPDSMKELLMTIT